MNTSFDAIAMKAMEKYTIENIGIPSLVLMEKAALSVKKTIMTSYPLLNDVIVFCGYGNNGADGLALARLLAEEDINVKIFCFGDKNKKSKEFLLQENIVRSLEIYIVELGYDFTIENIQKDGFDKKSCVFVDALFGIGLNRKLNESWIHLINTLNEIRMQLDVPFAAIDIPSGLNSTNGLIEGAAIACQITVTFSYAKFGHYLNYGPDLCGELYICSIGIYEHEIRNYSANNYAYNITDSDFKDFYENRFVHSHKGTYGKAVAIVGSDDMIGAALLSSKAIMHCGLGMLKVITSSESKEIIIKALPEIMVKNYSSLYLDSGNNKINFELIKNEVDWSDVILIGCGLSSSKAKINLLNYLITECNKVLVIDADGLNILAENINLLEIRKNKGFVSVLTPHPGEFARLFNKDFLVHEFFESFEKNNGKPVIVNRNSLHQSIPFCNFIAKKYGIILVSKDAKTIISDGNCAYINTSGNPGMASAGSGDILAGIITGVLSRNVRKINDKKMFTSFVAFSVYLHGLCGDKAKKMYGMEYMSATNIEEMLKSVINN